MMPDTFCVVVVICSKFITFAVTKTTFLVRLSSIRQLWFAQNSLPLRWQRQPVVININGDTVVICSKFITFAVTKTTGIWVSSQVLELWFAQNSLPLRWQRQRISFNAWDNDCCDLLKIHYLCGDKDNPPFELSNRRRVVICSKFITFAVTKTTSTSNLSTSTKLWFAQNSLPLRWQRQH